MKKRFTAAVVAGGLLGSIGLADAASAAQPAVQACLGDLFNGTAPEEGGPADGGGAIVSDNARNQPFGVSFGKQIQAVQSGIVPDAIIENSCND